MFHFAVFYGPAPYDSNILTCNKIQHSAVFHTTLQHIAVFYYPALHYIIERPSYTFLYPIILHYTAVLNCPLSHFNIQLPCTTRQYSTLPCKTLQCFTLLYSTALYHTAVFYSPAPYSSILLLCTKLQRKL